MVQSLYGKGQKGAVGGNSSPAPKPGDQDKMLQAVDSAYTSQFSDKDGNPLPNAPQDKDEVTALKGAAYRIMRSNDVTPEEAMGYAAKLMSPDAKNPDKTGFTAKKLDDDEGGGYEVKFGKRGTIKLSEDEFDTDQLTPKGKQHNALGPKGRAKLRAKGKKK